MWHFDCDLCLWSCAMGPFYWISFVVVFKRKRGCWLTLLTYLMTLLLFDRGKFRRITLTYCTLLWGMKHFLYVFWEKKSGKKFPGSSTERILRLVHLWVAKGNRVRHVIIWTSDFFNNHTSKLRNWASTLKLCLLIHQISLVLDKEDSRVCLYYISCKWQYLHGNWNTSENFKRCATFCL